MMMRDSAAYEANIRTKELGAKVERLNAKVEEYAAACIVKHMEIERLREALEEIRWSNNSKWQSHRAEVALKGEKA